MLLSLVIHTIFPHTTARPTRAYVVMALMLDLIIAAAVLTVAASGWMWLVDLVNYVKWGI